MKVKAKEQGFIYGLLREKGDTFTLKDEKHLGSWMQVIEEPKKEAPKKAAPKKKAPAKKKARVESDGSSELQ
jgi:hypothetical protein